ncbi:hypothetical protein [Crassaminicella profunda]|uniref:hypothetical protein n=1 Tax=Crassaminicella profunda TaxID=1286698 RepID=UPI001CA701E1|nr:hypothetical protein [Crassaminicella profunda]QZY54787.1 hypothetical protein K7H06_17440 [Crassaminicella profunda]
MDIVEKLLGHFIEAFLMTGAGLGLIGIRLKHKVIMWITIILGILIYGIRVFYIKNNIPFGTHIFILFICFIMLLRFIGKQRILDSMIAGLISFLLLLWGEGVFFFPVLKLFQFDPITLTSRPGGLLLATALSDVLLIIGFIIGYVFKITILDFKQFHENN